VLQERGSCAHVSNAEQGTRRRHPYLFRLLRSQRVLQYRYRGKRTVQAQRLGGIDTGGDVGVATLERSRCEDTILRAAIAEMRVLTVSAMPENLEEGIDLQQMADLLEYLKSAGNTNRAGR
jgi:hypothetical protein